LSHFRNRAASAWGIDGGTAQFVRQRSGRDVRAHCAIFLDAWSLGVDLQHLEVYPTQNSADLVRRNLAQFIGGYQTQYGLCGIGIGRALDDFLQKHPPNHSTSFGGSCACRGVRLAVPGTPGAVVVFGGIGLLGLHPTAKNTDTRAGGHRVVVADSSGIMADKTSA